jgi:hypothetical protein
MGSLYYTVRRHCSQITRRQYYDRKRSKINTLSELEQGNARGEDAEADDW